MELDRRVLIGGAIAATTTVGFGRAAGAATDGRAGRGTTELVLVGDDLRIAGAGSGTPQVGGVAVVTATLRDAASDTVVQLHGEYRAIASPNQVGSQAPTSIETHHFVFPDGSLVGTGVATFDDEEDQFTVVGGTGCHVGARGAYRAVQRHLGLGGDGVTSYHFTLIDGGI